MTPLHDYLLVKEVINNETIEGTNLKVKYDDSERFMTVEIVEASMDLVPEMAKYYPMWTAQDARVCVNNVYQPGNRLIINRVAKTPYKEGMYFISFKDVIAVESNAEQEEPETEEKYVQLQLDI